MNRIGDIANDLLRKYHAKENDFTDDCSVQLLTTILYSIVTEKRVQLASYSDIAIEYNPGMASYGLFAKINRVEFNRMLSNLINNAIEAIPERGKIIIKLSQDVENLVLIVADNGAGIPPAILVSLCNRGVTYGKKSGSGLGLHHAKATMQKFGGDLQLQSEMNLGTQVILTFPIAETPGWFLRKLEVDYTATLIILDKSASVHHLLQERFNKLTHCVKFINFTSLEKFKVWIDVQKAPQQFLYLFDLEYVGYERTRFNLVEHYQLQDCTILVTSHFDEKRVHDYCEKINMKMIPTDLVQFIPIVLNESY